MRKEEFGLAVPVESAAELATLVPQEGTGRLPWIQVEGSYFRTDTGEPWTPIGQNDSISWVEFNGLFRRRNLAGVDQHMARLAAHGVTCLRFMLEYAQVRHRYFERPIGSFPPNMVRLWDDLFALCEKHGLRILLTPFDTFWTWNHWAWHPYNRKNGGCLDKPSRILLCRETREAIKARLSFAAERWGGSGALFGWDLWNEIHPAHAENSAEGFEEFIHDISQHVRKLEMRLYGRTHPQTVSLFGPELLWKPEMSLREPIFRHPDLDFASIHIYQERTIDDPRNTVAPAVAMGQIVREALGEIRDGRPFLDTEHGPIHTFKDKHITLPEPFDDEYFRHMQWAHFASGAAGGGMRWPNRKPHVLTKGMREAQLALSRFLPLIDWRHFQRRNLNEEIEVSSRHVAPFACGDRAQALVWLLRKNKLGADRRVDRNAAPVAPDLRIPGLEPGAYRITAWDTLDGASRGAFEAQAGENGLAIQAPPFSADLALAIRAA